MVSYIFILIQEAKLDWLTATSSDEPLIGELLGDKFELSIPIFAEAADEGLLQELIDGEVLLLTFEYGHLAYVPAVVVERFVRTIVTHTDGIEVTRDGLIEGYTSLAVGAFDGAVATATLIVAGKHTILAIHNRGNKFTTRVVVRDTLTLYDFACLRQQLVPYLGQQSLHLFHLIGCDGRTSITFDTASTIATLKVAQEFLFEYVE